MQISSTYEQKIFQQENHLLLNVKSAWQVCQAFVAFP